MREENAYLNEGFHGTWEFYSDEQTRCERRGALGEGGGGGGGWFWAHTVKPPAVSFLSPLGLRRCTGLYIKEDDVFI